MKLLIVLFTHDKYVHLISKIWDRINNFDVPDGYIIDKLLITDADEKETIRYAEENSLPIKHISIDFAELSNYNIDPRYTNPSGFTFKTFFKVCKLRDFYLDIAKGKGYDWLLQIDGDVLPPKDGLISLLKENKRYIGAKVECKDKKGYYVTPDNSEGVYECEILGNCFHLEHKDIFNFKYTIADNIPPIADSSTRCKEIREAGMKIYCHPFIECEHLNETDK